jgi:hypothetical protein
MNMHKKIKREQHEESLMLATNLLEFGDIYSLFHENKCAWMIIPKQRHENGNFWIKRGLPRYRTTYVMCCAKKTSTVTAVKPSRILKFLGQRSEHVRKTLIRHMSEIRTTHSFVSRFFFCIS